MKEGRASKTAELVCIARAVAHGAGFAGRFEDPTALSLLPEEGRARVEQFRSGVVPKDARGRMKRAHLDRLSKLMVARTLTIDDAVRAASCPQLVILGAGLDGRAWRMPELTDVVVFEVDHPDSQRDKRARTPQLTQVARDVRFVAVDFSRDSLEQALADAGHDPARPTMWIWEGVVMYLRRRDIEATLEVIRRRSAPGSHLSIVYHSPALMLWVVGFVVRRMGEPLRSSFKAPQMRALLEKHGFSVESDEDSRTIGARLHADVRDATQPVKHLRVVTAVRSGA